MGRAQRSPSRLARDDGFRFALPILRNHAASTPNQLVREIADRLAVDRRPVPLAHGFEIRRALAVGRAALEAAGVQQVCGGGENIGDAVAEVDVAVAIEIDAVLDVGRWQKLRLADFAGEGANQVAQGEIAALHDLQRRQQFALEQFGAAAIMRHGGQGADDRHLADVALAEIRRKPPNRDHDFRRHAELLLDTRQQRSVPLQHLPADVDAPGADAGRDILLERFVEGAALAAVEGQHRRILRHTRKRLADHGLRDAGSRRLLRHRRHEGVEVAAAAGGVGRGGADDGAEENGPTNDAHANPLLILASIMPWESGARNLVVPAHAGTHTPRPMLLKRVGRRLRLSNGRRWLWVPAFAGTTRQWAYSPPPSICLPISAMAF